MKRGGTETSRPLDIGRVSQALRHPGIDPRHWLSYGTVCTINESDGSANFSDGSAVSVLPGGCTVDVMLMPANQHVACRYSGVQGGSAGTVYTPVRPGDEVIVGIPDGDLRLPPVILAILSGEHSPLPLDVDRTPIWKNDRVLIHATNTPIEIRTAGGAKIVVAQDGTVTVNDGTKGAARRDDTTKLSLSEDDLTALALRLTSPSGPVTVAPGLPVVFEGGQITSSSETVKIG